MKSSISQKKKRKNSAPRRKAVAAREKLELRGTKLSTTVQICNAAKYTEVREMLDRTLTLKQRMSAMAHDDLADLFLDAYAVKARYKEFTSADLNAWERQALFHDIVGDYQRALVKRFSNAPFILQKSVGSWSYATYKRGLTRTDGTLVLPGAVKPDTFVLDKRKNSLAGIANYLMHCPFIVGQAFDFESVGEKMCPTLMLLASTKPAIWQRLLEVVSARRARLLSKQKTIHYVTGTHRRHPKESSSGVVYDASNGKYQYFLKIRLGNTKKRQADGKLDYDYAFLPLLYNAKRFNPQDLLLTSEFRLKAGKRKIHVCTLFEAPELKFKPAGHVVGADANTKHNLLADSDGKIFDYDRRQLDRIVTFLKRTDEAKSDGKLTYRQTARISAWVRANEGLLKQRLAQVLDEWESAGATDIVLEDLSMSSDATFIKHAEFDIKYSRLSRLLRLSNLKNWLIGQAEKRGIRVHVTHAAYSSQECPKCHHISRKNRKVLYDVAKVCRYFWKSCGYLAETVLCFRYA